jgi:hypothetical protein
MPLSVQIYSSLMYILGPSDTVGTRKFKIDEQMKQSVRPF